MATIYKPMTPSLRRKIDSAYDKLMAELNECENNCYVQMLRNLYETQRNLLTSLPDGYLVPMTKEADNAPDDDL